MLSAAFYQPLITQKEKIELFWVKVIFENLKRIVINY